MKLGRIGFEIELLAPPGRSRRDLAEAIAADIGGTVTRVFHPQGEPSRAKGTPFFENLTLGFEIRDRTGRVVAHCVDDLTLNLDLDRKAPPKAGWYRVVSDDARLLRLVDQNTLATEPLERVLDPVARLFGVEPERGAGGMIRVGDELGAPIAIAAPLPGERERPCELVTRPIDENHAVQLGRFLELAAGLEFTVPAEGATHLHFDADPLCDAGVIANLVRYFSRHREALRERFETNPRCSRLGDWPPELLERVEEPAFATLPWPEARERLAGIPLTKYCDFNLVNIVRRHPAKHTFEVRILPVRTEAASVIEAAHYFNDILDWARGGVGRLLKVPERLR